MALKFQIRGTQMDAYYASAFKAHANCGTGTAALVSSGLSGVFGGSLIDLVNSGSGGRRLSYIGLENFSRNGAFTVLMRIVPNFTGAPASTLSLISVGPADGNQAHGIRVKITTAQKLNVIMANAAGSGTMNEDSTTNIPLTTDVPTDIWFTFSGTTGAGSFNMYAAANGNSPTSIGSFNGGVTIGAGARSLANLASFTFGTDSFASYANHKINEVCIWDTVETPSSYGARTDFITASAFEGYSYTDPGIANVKTATAYTYAGASLTGTYTGSDRWSDPGVSTVLSGIAYKADSTTNNRTGTFVVPTAAEITTAVLAGVVETGYTLKNSMRLMLSAMAGKISGAPTASVTIRNVVDNKNRIVATVDANGNRTALTYDVTD